MNFRLLLDIDVVEFMATLPRREQVALRRRLGEIQSFPTRFADFQEPDSLTGRSLDVHVHCGFAIYYWEDLADRHIKVFSIRRADACGYQSRGVPALPHWLQAIPPLTTKRRLLAAAPATLRTAQGRRDRSAPSPRKYGFAKARPQTGRHLSRAPPPRS